MLKLITDFFTAFIREYIIAGDQNFSVTLHFESREQAKKVYTIYRNAYDKASCDGKKWSYPSLLRIDAPILSGHVIKHNIYGYYYRWQTFWLDAKAIFLCFDPRILKNLGYDPKEYAIPLNLIPQKITMNMHLQYVTMFNIYFGTINFMWDGDNAIEDW